MFFCFLLLPSLFKYIIFSALLVVIHVVVVIFAKLCCRLAPQLLVSDQKLLTNVRVLLKIILIACSLIVGRRVVAVWRVLVR